MLGDQNCACRACWVLISVVCSLFRPLTVTITIITITTIIATIIATTTIIIIIIGEGYIQAQAHTCGRETEGQESETEEPENPSSVFAAWILTHSLTRSQEAKLH